MSYIHYLIVAFIITKYRPNTFEVITALLIGVGSIISTQGDLYMPFNSFVICLGICGFSALHSLLVSKEAGESSKLSVWDITLAYSVISSALNLTILYYHGSINSLSISNLYKSEGCNCGLIIIGLSGFLIPYLHNSLIVKNSPQTYSISQTTLEVIPQGIAMYSQEAFKFEDCNLHSLGIKSAGILVHLFSKYRRCQFQCLKLKTQ